MTIHCLLIKNLYRCCSNNGLEECLSKVVSIILSGSEYLRIIVKMQICCPLQRLPKSESLEMGFKNQPVFVTKLPGDSKLHWFEKLGLLKIFPIHFDLFFIKFDY